MRKKININLRELPNNMKTPKKKTAFKTPTARQILDYTENSEIKPTLAEMSLATTSSDDGKSFRINGDILPVHQNTYKKYWETMIIPQRNHPDGTPMMPYELRRLAFDEWLEIKLNKAKSNITKLEDLVPFSSFAYTLPSGFGTTKKTYYIDIAKAAKLYKYASWGLNNFPRIDVNAYYLQKDKFVKLRNLKERVAKEGAQFLMNTPSTSKRFRYGVYEPDLVTSIPVVEENKHNIAFYIDSSHNCWDKTIRCLTFPDMNQERIKDHFCFHDIADMFAIIDYFLNPQERGSNEPPNTIPLQMNLTGIPTESFARNLDTLEHRAVILPTGKTKERRLNDAEINYILSGIVLLTGHDMNLFAEPNKELGRKLKEYNWTSIDTYRK
jgi:hypothetical protein